MSRRVAAGLGWSIWVAGLALIAIAAALAAHNPPISTTQVPESTVEGVIWVSSWIGFGLVGAILVTSRPRNRMAWILSGITFWLGMSLFLPAYARYGLVTTGGALPLGGVAAWLATWNFIPVVCLVVALVVLFPTGSPTTAFGRWVLRVFFALAAVEMVAYALRPGPIEGDTPPNNPLGVPGTKSQLDAVIEGIGAALTVVAILGLVDLVLRYLRSHGVERQQLRWFVTAVAAFPILFFLAILLEETVIGYETFDPVVLVFFLWGNGTAVAIGIAVTRHGLYEIDRIISRTVTYTLVVGVLAAVFFGLVTLLAGLLSPEQPLVVAASTMAVFALFNPLRRRVQKAVDRRFNRSRYDAERAIQDFSGRLRDQVELDELARGLNSVTIESMHPESVALWVKGDEETPT